MKKNNCGIIRNKTAIFTSLKKKKTQKRHRFQKIGKEDDQISQSNSNTANSDHLQASTESVQSRDDHHNCAEIYKQASFKIQKVATIQKKISELTKLRLSSFKEKENQKYDEKISKLASEATNLLVAAEKNLRDLRLIEGENEAERKFLKNIEFALASQIRETSRCLRQQEKQYFSRIRSYESSTTNSAIELTEEQRKMMLNSDELELLEEKNDMRNDKITQLVHSINKLSGIYKELNQLVIQQGSLIDRIDVNIEQTLEHTKKAVVHLQGANQAADSPFADKVIKMLVIAIIVCALALGIKYMN